MGDAQTKSSIGENMIKPKEQEPKPTIYQKPVKLETPFDEAIKRIVKVPPPPKK
jgi:hypothetical protein